MDGLFLPPTNTPGLPRPGGRDKTIGSHSPRAKGALMKITPTEVAHVAALARLRLEPGQSAKLTGQLNDILINMDKLGELDTAGVASTNHALALTGAMRPDEIRPSLPRQDGLANAPESDGASFIVPRVI